jgi:hypothetical protein
MAVAQLTCSQNASYMCELRQPYCLYNRINGRSNTRSDSKQIYEQDYN